MTASLLVPKAVTPRTMPAAPGVSSSRSRGLEVLRWIGLLPDPRAHAEDSNAWLTLSVDHCEDHQSDWIA